jgi:hypothetical protein
LYTFDWTARNLEGEGLRFLKALPALQIVDVEKVVQQFLANDHPAADIGIGAFNVRTDRSIGSSLISPEMRYRNRASVVSCWE